MAAVPDFGGLAAQQTAANNDATRQTTWANRPDQYNRLGSTTWNQDASGRWINNTTLDPWANDLFGRTMSGSQNLSSQVGAGLSQDGLMGWGSSDLTRGAVAMPDSGFGATQSVIDAWQRLQQPDLDKNAAATRARMAAMGLTQGSRISNNAERGINDAYGTARDKAILAGTTEYGNVFNRGMQSRQQTVDENLKSATLQNSMRGQQYGERKDAFSAANAGLQNLTQVRDSLNPNNWNQKAPAAASYVPTSIYGAAMDSFNANRQNENADIAQRNQNTSSAIQALQAAGGLSGIGSAASGLWGAAQNAWGGYYGTGANTYGATFWNGGQDDLSSFLAGQDYYGTNPGNMP